VIVLAWLGWRSWRHRTLHPLLVLGTSLLLLNVTVGAVKYGLGRLGPHYATTIGSNEMFAGGDIFPSGHTANAVVTWGVLAYLATTQRARRLGSVISALLALGVGATTVYLGTHWVSDVLLGWAAGLLILLALPWFEPAMARAEDAILAGWARLRNRSRRRVTAPAAGPATGPGLVGPRTPEHDDEPSRETIGAGTAVSAQPGGAVTAQAGGTVNGPANGSHPAARPAPGRGEHTPTTPLGSRRPPVERPVRPAPPLVHRQARGRGLTG
jgi:hypothetical protein